MRVVDWLNHLKQSQQPFRDRLRDPYYRFRSVVELQRAAALGVRIDVNQASIDDWLRLPGLSIHQARSLVTLSQSGVPFHGLEDVAAALSLPAQRLQPFSPILQFCFYEHDTSVQLINPNQASLAQLTRLPGIDQALAQHILDERQKQGAYKNLLDFRQRLRLESQAVAELMHYLRFN